MVVQDEKVYGVISQGQSTNERKQRLRQRFQVVKKLGQGTYGKVQLAINRETKQEVAIKTIKKAKIENEQDLVRIRREIQIMSSIQHPHVIHIYEVFENQEKIVLVMQYASGGELYDYLGCHKKLPEKEARRIFRQMAAAIYYCHKNKICHRDLKLENILLDDKGNAKIADFGLSNVFDEKQKLHTFCGSPLYASPEIVKGTPYCGPEVDCWSLGVLLYTLVYGAMPFDGSNFKRLVRQISEGSYYEPSIKSSASGIIRRLLSVDVSRRANIKDICLDEWVNEGYDQSLLTVANDMANLTPGQLDSSPSISFLSNAAVVGRSLFSHLPVAKKNYSLITRNAGQTKKIAERTLPSFVPLVEMQVARPMRLQTKNGLKFNTEFHSSADGTLNIRQPKEEEVEQATNETLHEVIIVMKAILSRVENIIQESNITKAIDGLKNGKIVSAQTNFAYSPHVHSGKTFYIRPISGINNNTQDIQLVCVSESQDNVKQTDPIKNLSSNMNANKDEHKTHLNTKHNLEVCKITLSPKSPALESIQSWKKEHSEKHPENGRTYLTKGNISTEMEISKYGAGEVGENITSSINAADQIKLRQDKTEKTKFGQIESDSIVPIFNVSSNIPKRLNGKVHSDYEKELVNEGTLQSSTVKNMTAESEYSTSNFTTKNETTKFKCANFANVPKNPLLEVNYLQKQADSEKVAITPSSPESLIPIHKSETSVPEKDFIVTDVTNGIASCPKEIISNQQAKQLCLEINEMVLNNHSEESKLSVKNKDCEQQLENKCVSYVQTDYGIKQTNIQTVKEQSQTHMRVFPVAIVSNCNRNGLSPNLDQNLGNEDAATFDVTHGKVDVKCKASVNSNSICLNTKLPNNLNKNNESSYNNNEIQETNIGENDSKIDDSSYDTTSKEEVPLSSENTIYCNATTNDLNLVRDSSCDMVLARKNNSELENIVVNENIQILSNTLSDNINEDGSNSQNSLSDPSSQYFGKHGLRNYPDISKESNPNSRNNIIILGKNTVSDTENDTIILGKNISESSTVIKIMEKEPDLNHKIPQKPRRYILSRIRAASIEFERIPEWTKKESGSQKKLPGKITIPKYFDETCCLNKSLEKKDIILIPTVSVAENKEKLEKKIEMVKRSALTMKSRRKSDAGTRPKYKKYTRSCTDVLHKLIKCDRTCEAVDFLETNVINLNELCNDKDDNFISSSKYQNTKECFDDETPLYDCEDKNEMWDCSASNNEQKGYEERFDDYAGDITDGVSYREQHCRSSNKDTSFTTEKKTIVNDVHGPHKDTKNSGAKQNGYTPITRCCKKINFPPEQVSKTECENKCMECKDKSSITNDIESETCHLIDDMNTIEKSIESGKCTISNQMQLHTKCKTENQIIQKSERQVSDRDYKREINGESGYNDDNSKNLSSRKCQNTDWLSNYLYDRDSSDNDDELDIMISDSKLDAYGSDSLWKFLKTVNKDINGRLKTLKHARKPLYARSKSQDSQIKDSDNSEKSITRSLSKEDKQQLSLETGMSKCSSEITNKYSGQSQSNLTLDNDNDEHEDLDDSSNSASNLSLPSYKSLESIEKSACCDTYHNASLPATMKMKRYSLCNLADNSSFPNIRRLQEVNDYDKCKYWRSIQGVDAIDENNVQKNNEMYPQIASPLTQRQSLYGTLRPRKLTKDKRSKSQMQLNGDSDFSSLYSEKKRLFNQSDFKSSDLVHSGMVKNKALSDLDISFTETLYNNAELPSASYNDALTKNSLRFSTSLGSRLNLDTRVAQIDALKTEAYNNAKENQNCKKPMRRALYSSALDISNPLNSSFLTLPTVRKHQIFNDIKLDTDNKPEISEESGSLLEALKTHGYKSIMSQRLRQTDVNYNETQTSKLSSVGMRGTSNSIGGDFYTVPQYHISANMDPVEYARRMYLNRKLSNPSMDIRDGQLDTMLNAFSNNRIPRKTDFTSGVLPDMWQYQPADELRLTRSLDKRFAFPLCTSNIGVTVNRSRELDSEWENNDLCKINFAQMKNNVENESEFLQDKQDFETKSTENTMEKLSMKIQALKNRCHQKSLDESETSKDTESNTFSSQSINTTFERSTKENEEGINSTIIPDSLSSEKQEQESVSDRIWRKSFYSRFNDLPTLRRRRSTLMDSDFLIDTQSSKSIKRSSVGESPTGERKMVFGREPNNRHTKEERSLNSILMKQSLNESKFEKSLIAEHNIPNHLMDDNAKTDNGVP